MLRLATPFTVYPSSVGTACLPNAETLAEGNDVIATGWGIEFSFLGISFGPSDVLKEESIAGRK
jgi:hypothetical protein